VSFSSLQGRVPIGILYCIHLDSYYIIVTNLIRVPRTRQRRQRRQRYRYNIHRHNNCATKGKVYIDNVHGVYCIYMINIAQNKKNCLIRERLFKSRRMCIERIPGTYYIIIYNT